MSLLPVRCSGCDRPPGGGVIITVEGTTLCQSCLIRGLVRAVGFDRIREVLNELPRK